MAGRRFALWLAAAALLFGLPLSAVAISVTWVFEGRVEIRDFTQRAGGPVGIEAALTSLGVVPGAIVRRSVIFETSTPDADSYAPLGQYWDAVLDARLSLGGLELRMGTPSLGPANGIIISAFPLNEPPVSARDT